MHTDYSSRSASAEPRHKAPRTSSSRFAAPANPAVVAEPAPLPVPVLVVDEIAREEWRRVAHALTRNGALTLAQHSLLAGYCNAVAKAVRAEQTLAVEGRYYQTRSHGGSLMRRRHPAAQDAEEGWTTARKFAKQLGIMGVASGEHGNGDASRRRLFK